MPPVFIGLDGEMTGLDWQTHRLIQIGVATGLTATKTFVSDIGWSCYEWEPTALLVNGFTHERIQFGSNAVDVDRALVTWFPEGTKRKGLVPVGWNVAGFDLPFIRNTLPMFASLLSYRTVDLNAVCFAVAGTTGNAYKSLKSRAKEYAEAMLDDEKPQWHDAGYDARASLAAFEYLSRIINNRQAA